MVLLPTELHVAGMSVKCPAPLCQWYHQALERIRAGLVLQLVEELAELGRPDLAVCGSARFSWLLVQELPYQQRLMLLCECVRACVRACVRELCV